MAARIAVGIVGIGRMGRAMAARLAATHDVSVYDIQTGVADKFVSAFGGTACKTLEALAALSDVVITMLPNSRVVETVVFGEGDNLASRLKPGSILVDMSSGAPGRTLEIANRLKARSIGMIDAPVSGGVARAETGDLAIMIGADNEDLVARCEPLFALMGTSMLRTGGIGSGHAMKALNNLVSAGGFLIGIEALLVGRKFGLDPNTMIDVLNVSTGMNNSTQKKFKQFVMSRSFGSGFAIDLMVKDLTNALELAQETEADTPFAKACRDLWASALGELGAGEDHTAITKVAEKRAGIRLDAA